MKKLAISNKFKKTAKEPEVHESSTAQRVTNDTVSNHRDAVLSRGRQFKYPFHRSKHRITIISLLITLTALLLLGLVTGLQLYKRQSTSDFTYRVTQILPFPVAKVAGDTTSYESYLFELKSSLHWQEKYGTTDLKSPDGKRQIEYLKRSALDKALTNTIAHSFAAQENISVAEKEIDDVVARIKSSGGNLTQILGENFDFTESELRRYIQDSILRQKVAHQLDKDAPKRAETALAQIRAGQSFTDVATVASDDLETKPLGGDIGVVEKEHANLPAEVVEAVFALKAGEVSGVITTPGDYFIVTVTEKVDENRAKVAIIRISVKDMAQYLKDYQDQNKVKEYIKLNDITSE